MEFKFLKPKKSAKWWTNCKDIKVKWFTKRNGDYWIIPGSEFPEKKLSLVPIDEKGKKKKLEYEKKDNTLHICALILSIGLGISLAINIIHHLTK
jgi:hypothetical protein